MGKKKEKQEKKEVRMPDFFYRVAHEVKLRSAKTGEYIRDSWGRIKTRTVYGKPEAGYYNERIDCYEIYVNNQYFATLHVPLGTLSGYVYMRALERYKTLANYPADMVDIRYDTTVI